MMMNDESCGAGGAAWQLSLGSYQQPLQLLLQPASAAATTTNEDGALLLLLLLLLLLPSGLGPS